MDRKTSNKEEFIEKSKLIHGDKFDYSLVEYVNNKTKVKIICKTHGVFLSVAKDHYLRGDGCRQCSNEKLNKLFSFSKEQFIINSINIHGNKYDYSLVNYINKDIKVKIICPEHGLFEQTPGSHNNTKTGCPTCKESHGEKEIAKLLTNLNIVFERYKRFPDCKLKKPLSFDFYLPKLNTCIEFDGKQHFVADDYYGGQKEFELVQKRDKIKNNYCKNKNINLIRINYKEDISTELKKHFKSCS